MYSSVGLVEDFPTTLDRRVNFLSVLFFRELGLA